MIIVSWVAMGCGWLLFGASAYAYHSARAEARRREERLVFPRDFEARQESFQRTITLHTWGMRISAVAAGFMLASIALSVGVIIGG